MKFEINASIENLLNAAKMQGLQFLVFESYQGKSKRGEGGRGKNIFHPPSRPSRLGLKLVVNLKY